MKIVLDVTRLVAEGKLTPEEAERLTALAARDTGALAINVLLSFGVIAVAAGVIILHPAFETGIVLGLLLIAAGLYLSVALAAQWGLLGTASVAIGALLLAGGAIGLADGKLVGFLFAAVVLLAAALAVRSGLLMALVPLVLAGALGSSTGYFHASYMLVVREATITIGVFGLLAWAAYVAGRRVGPPYEALAFVFARVSLILVNLGFWIGSLWGDIPGESWWTDVGERRAWREMAWHVPDMLFVVTWAAALIGVGIWAARANRRWVVAAAATFGAIHFYTQWFERLGANPVTIIVGGLIVVAIAIGLWRYSRAAPAQA